MTLNPQHKLITSTFTRDPAPVGISALNVQLHLLADADFDGDRTLRVFNGAEVDALVTATDITAIQGARIKRAFEQQPRPAYVLLGTVDVDGSETYPQAYDDISLNLGESFQYLTADTRDATVQMALAAKAADDLVTYVALTLASEALGTTLASVYTNVTQDWMVLIWGITETVANAGDDVAYAAARGTFDPDRQSVGWQGFIRGGEPLPDETLTAAQVANALAQNVNLKLYSGGRPNYVSPGRTYSGQPIKENTTIMWYLTRLRERLLDLKHRKDNAGQLIPVDPAGQSLIRAEISSLFEQGVGNPEQGLGGHFAAGQLLLEFPDPILQADRDNGIIRTQRHAVTLLGNAEAIELSTIFTREDVIVEETE